MNVLEALRLRKKGDPAYVMRNLYALIPNSPVLAAEKQMAVSIREHQQDLVTTITARLKMVDDEKFAELADLQARKIELSPLKDKIVDYKNFGAIPALNLPPDDPNYQAFWRGVLTPVNGLVVSFNYEDDPLAPLPAVIMLAATIAAPEVMIPVMLVAGTPHIAIEIGTGVSNLREADAKLLDAKKRGDEAGIKEWTAKRNLAIEKITAASTEFTMMVAPIALPKVFALVRNGKNAEAIALLRTSMRAEGKSLNDIEFNLRFMRDEIGKMPEGPSRQLSEQMYRNQLEMFDTLAQLEKGDFAKSPFKATKYKEVKIDGVTVKVPAEFDPAMLPKKGGAPVANEPVPLKPGEILTPRETTGPPAPRKTPAELEKPGGTRGGTRSGSKTDDIGPPNHNWKVVDPTDPAIALRVDRFHEQLAQAKKLYDQGRFNEAVDLLRQDGFLRKSNIELRDVDTPRTIEVDTSKPLTAEMVERDYSPTARAIPPEGNGPARVEMAGRRYKFVEKGTGKELDLDHPALREFARDQFWNHVEEIKHAISQQSGDVSGRVVVSKTYRQLLKENPGMPYNEEVDVMLLRTQDFKDFAPEPWMTRYEDRIAFTRLYGKKLPNGVTEALTEGGPYSLGPKEAKWWPSFYDDAAAAKFLSTNGVPAPAVSGSRGGGFDFLRSDPGALVGERVNILRSSGALENDWVVTVIRREKGQVIVEAMKADGTRRLQPLSDILANNDALGPKFNVLSDAVSRINPNDLVGKPIKVIRSSGQTEGGWTVMKVEGTGPDARVWTRDGSGQTRAQPLSEVVRVNKELLVKEPVPAVKPVAPSPPPTPLKPPPKAPPIDPALLGELKTAGLDLTDVVKVGDTTFKMSGLFDLGDGRLAAFAMVDGPGTGGPVMTVFYRSNSQGVFRVLPAVNKGGARMVAPGYDKGIGEYTLGAPRPVQEHLAGLVNKNQVSALPKADANVLVEKVVRVNNSPMDYVEYAKGDRYIGNVIEKPKPLTDAPDVLHTPSKHIVAEPRDLRIPDALRPDFSKPVSTYKTSTATAGEVTATVYKSADGSLEYTVFQASRDGGTYVWFGEITPAGGTISPYGVYRSPINPGDLTMPLWEYRQQIPPELTGGVHPTKGSYSDAWGYVGRIPEIIEWYRTTKTPMPPLPKRGPKH